MNNKDSEHTEQIFLKELEKVHKHNALMNLLDGTFFALGFSCILPGIVIVSFLRHYTENKFILNLPILLSTVMFTIGPFLASFISGRYRQKKKIFMVTATGHRIAWVPVLLSVIIFRNKPQILLITFFIFYGIFYAFWGWNSIFWREMMGRVLHPAHQATAMGLRESVSNLVGFASAFGVMTVLTAISFPKNYIILFSFFLITFFCTLFFLYRFKEVEYPVTEDESPAKHIQNLFSLPVKDRAFKWFIIFILFSYGYLLTGSLYTTICLERFSTKTTSDNITGIMTILSLLSTTVFSFLLGRIGDKKGILWGYIPGIVAGIIMPFMAIFFKTLPLYLIIFLLTGSIGSTWFIELFVTLNASTPEKRHLYIAFVSLVKTVPVVIYTNVGGWLAQHISIQLPLVISSILCVISLFILLFKLKPLWEEKKKKFISPVPEVL